MLLDIESRIGELALAIPKGATAKKGSQGGASVEPPKHERLGIPSAKRMQQSELIHRHPEAVERVKRKAREGEIFLKSYI